MLKTYGFLAGAQCRRKGPVQYISTRGEAPSLGFTDAMLAGLALTDLRPRPRRRLAFNHITNDERRDPRNPR